MPVVDLALPFRAPLDLGGLFAFLRARAVPGVEDAGARHYRRSLRLPRGPAVVELRPGDGDMAARLSVSDTRDVADAEARVRALLGLDADPEPVAAALGDDPHLGPLLRENPGIRVPGAVDGAEIVARAVLGQQVSVAAARTTTGRLAAALGEPISGDAASGRAPVSSRGAPISNDSATGGNAASHGARASNGDTASNGEASDGAPATNGDPASNRDSASNRNGTSDGNAASSRGSPSTGHEPITRLFPTAAALAEGAAHVLTGSRRRTETLRTACAAIADGTLAVHADREPDRLREELQRIPGVGPWTANYVVLRVLGDPDVLLDGDLALRRGAARLGLPERPDRLREHAERWRPWRSYAGLLLWRANQR